MVFDGTMESYFLISMQVAPVSIPPPLPTWRALGVVIALSLTGLLGAVQGLLGQLFLFSALLLLLVVLGYHLGCLRQKVALVRCTIGFDVGNWPLWMLAEDFLGHHAQRYFDRRLRRGTPSMQEITVALLPDFQGTLRELLQTGQRLSS